MKVFLSWSGEKSHKVAMVFRDWFPSVIQSLEPYVSSEDIDKGARWSTDIAKELEDSSFGILCVTKENLNAPWLTFEAGALSKTMDKSFVSPFLFDIKRSEVDGPILQFQSTIFDHDDVLKLLKTLNKACGEDMLAEAMIEKAFDVWWPTLESDLDALRAVREDKNKSGAIVPKTDNNEILEEILDISRLNQKLLRNPDNDFGKALVEVNERLNSVAHSIDREKHFRKRRMQRFHPSMLNDLLMESEPGKPNYIGFQMILSLYKEEFPWLYDGGLELIKALKSRLSAKAKRDKMKEFLDIVRFTTDHPIAREFFGADRSSHMFLKELPFMLENGLRLIDRDPN